jgi:hypothetical protein
LLATGVIAQAQDAAQAAVALAYRTQQLSERPAVDALLARIAAQSPDSPGIAVPGGPTAGLRS